MYQIKCDDLHLYDYRLPDLIVSDPKLKVEVNTVGEASFVIHRNHPNYPQLKVLKSIFEISDEIGVIFRGRMTNNSQDFHNSKAVDLEGLMAFFNDSVVRPFKFPEDFTTDAEYISASQNGNVVKFFLNWLIDNHNSQVQDFQKFKLGKVTVADPNNYITRSESKYANTWEILKNKLFDSALGGYLCIRYEEDGNYIDYLSEFELTNTQEIQYGENLIDLKNEIDAASTYSAIIPLGAEIETEETDENGEKVKKVLDLKSVPDGEVAPGIMKQGDTIYSQSAVNDFGWIYAPVDDTTWNDVTLAQNLLSKGIEYLAGEGVKLQNNIEINAVDLHFNDAEIRSFRPYRNIKVNSLPHNQEALFPLTKLEIDLLRPQNTKIVLGRTQRTLSEITNDRYQGTLDYIQSATDELKGKVSVTQNSLNDLNTKVEGIDGTYLYIMYSPYEDGHEMTNTPDENTMYMGTCSTNAEERPTDHTKYTWVKVRGLNGKGVAKVENYYLTTDKDSGVTNEGLENPQEKGWLLESIEKLTAEKPYLWNFERTFYTDDNYTDSAPSLIGNYAKDGEKGVGIEEIQEWYALSTDKDTIPEDDDWSQVLPTMTATDRYLWNYEVIIYTEGKPVQTDPLIIGVYGDKGTPGDPGQNGKTQYWHIKYSDDGKNFTDNNGETLGAWIGIYVDFNEADSDKPEDYTWKKFTEDVDAELADIKTVISSQQAYIERTEEKVGIIASKSYVETSAFQQYKEEVEAEFEVNAEQIDMKFTTTTEQIDNINGDLQSKFEKVSKYISFNENGISIGGGADAMLLTVDNDNGIIFSKNGVPFGWWDGVDFHTGNIVVEVNERAQFGNFAFVPRSDGSLSFLKVYGSSTDAHTHKYVETVLTAATCTNTGTKTVLCTGCGDNRQEIIAALGHNYTSVVTAPTETAQGYTTHTCIHCGDSYKDNYTPATGTPTTYYTITVNSSNTSYGTVSGGGSYESGTTATITATPYSGYTFKQWNDGNTNATRTITVTGNATYTAIFEVEETDKHTINTSVSPVGAGTVTGGGTYDEGTPGTVTATPANGYTFDHWVVTLTDSGESITMTDNPCNFTVTYDASFKAVFVSSSGGGTLVDGDTITEGVTTPVSISTAKELVYLKFVPQYSGSYTFESLDKTSLDPDGYVYNSEKNTELARSTNTGAFSATYDNFVAGTTYYLAATLYSGTGTLNVKVSYNGSSSGGGSGEKVQITIGPEFTQWGEVSVNGGTATNQMKTYEFSVGETVTVRAYPGAYGFTFWLNENNQNVSSDNPYSFTVTSNSPTTLRAN